MYNEQTIGVVVPAYNEAANVGDVITSMPPFVDRIYVVDDASTDGTWDVVTDRAAELNGRTLERALADGGVNRSPRVVPIRHDENRGAGGAVKTGYRHALADDIDVTAVMDGDGQMDPSELERIIRPVVGGVTTYAKGNRLYDRRHREGMSGFRLFGNWMLTMLTRAASGYWSLSDPQNGFTAISSTGLRRLPVDRLTDDYGFLNHVLVALNGRTEPIADVPHKAIYRDEESGITYSTFIPGVSWLLARSFTRRIWRSYVVRRFHPLVACYALGPVAVVAGTGGMVAAMASSAVPGFVGGMLSFVVFLLGSLLLVLGCWFDIRENEGLFRSFEPVEMDALPHDSDRSTPDPNRYPVVADDAAVEGPPFEGASQDD